MTSAILDRLVAAIDRHAALAVAVSGGVDSMTLAHVAQRLSRSRIEMLHAVSPAVPSSAQERVVRHARLYGWTLRLIDAGELSDARYAANPVNRCYFCKTNLYARIRHETDAVIASGTNTDDLSDFRPGLHAAQEWGVVHPYVEAGLSKADIYGLARDLGLDDLAALPAQPCLASRIETGTPVTPEDLRFIETVEARITEALGAGAVVRCRVTADGVAVEVGPAASRLAPDRLGEIAEIARSACSAAERVFLGVRDYRRGSAFVGA